jgi:hypothetical protein
MVKEQRGESRSAGRRLPRVVRQYLGDSSRYRTLGQSGSARMTSSRYCWGIDAVQAARGDEAEDGGGALGVGVAAVKHPVFSAYDES